ncbi:MAG TPA: phenylalanine--tRNA ligase subunit alpha [Nitrososphaeraceae archaeon]|nr:phenylalanine--tRNA ligase subunit alpha [Nitrososphaeraceae archaeon]
MDQKVSALHPIEKSILELLSREGPITIEALSKKSHLTIDQIRRGVEWLRFKKLLVISQDISIFYELGDCGKSALVKGLPERRLVTIIESGVDRGIASVAKKNLFDKNELGAAIRIARDQNRWLVQSSKSSDGSVLEVTKSAQNLSQEEKVIERFQTELQLSASELNETELKGVELLLRRPDYLIKKKNEILTLSLSDRGKATANQITDQNSYDKDFITQESKRDLQETNVLDVQAAVKSLPLGKTHPLTDLISEVKEIFLSLGFTEIEGDLIQTTFWNFDALFTLQDHPARQLQDTFYLSGLKTAERFATENQIRSVSRVHKIYSNNSWNINESRRLVLRTHTTPVTIKYLADTCPNEAKIFSVGTVFRNEKMTKGHLSEFYQIEGVVTESDATMQDLMGLQLEFYRRLGIQKVKFWPTFFPYTEPSIQSMVYNEKVSKWMELFGMGIFRDEVTKPLKIKNPVLAWGGGLERLAMLRLGIDDIRTLYSNKIEWLRGVPKCQL